MEFSEILCQLRKATGKSQASAAKDIGETQRNFSYWERGQHEPGIKSISALCRYYDVSADYLLGLTQEKKPCPKE